MARKVICVVQARMDSTRLPGKALIPILEGEGGGRGEPMIATVLKRCLGANVPERVFLATTAREVDDPLVEEASKLGVKSLRWGGTEEEARDVLSRFYHAFKTGMGNDDDDDDDNDDNDDDDPLMIVRVTGDCPLMDPYIIDVIARRARGSLSYWSNVNPRTIPDCFDVEAFDINLLYFAHIHCEDGEKREHLGPALRENAAFIWNLAFPEGCGPDVKLSVDTQEDLEKVRRFYKFMGWTSPPDPDHIGEIPGLLYNFVMEWVTEVE